MNFHWMVLCFVIFFIVLCDFCFFFCSKRFSLIEICIGILTFILESRLCINFMVYIWLFDVFVVFISSSLALSAEFRFRRVRKSLFGIITQVYRHPDNRLSLALFHSHFSWPNHLCEESVKQWSFITIYQQQ